MCVFFILNVDNIFLSIYLSIYLSIKWLIKKVRVKSSLLRSNGVLLVLKLILVSLWSGWYRSSYYYFNYTHLGVIHTSISWWFSTGVWDERISSLVSRTLLSILVDHNNAVIWMVFTPVLIFSSSTTFTRPFVTVLSALITIVITVTRSRNGFFFSPFFNFIL